MNLDDPLLTGFLANLAGDLAGRVIDKLTRHLRGQVDAPPYRAALVRCFQVATAALLPPDPAERAALQPVLQAFFAQDNVQQELANLLRGRDLDRELLADLFDEAGGEAAPADYAWETRLADFTESFLQAAAAEEVLVNRIRLEQARQQNAGLLQLVTNTEAIHQAVRQLGRQLQAGSGDVSFDSEATIQGDVITGSQIKLIQQQITLIFQQPFQPPPDLAQLRRDYLAYLRRRYRYLDMRGLVQVQQVMRELPLTAVYVPLKATTREAGPQWGRIAGRFQALPEALLAEATAGRAGRAGPTPVEEALAGDPAVVVLGDPGAGKSTLLKVLTLALAANESGPLPILLPLNAYARHLREHGDLSLSRFLGRYYAAQQDRLAQVGQLFDAALQAGQAVLLLDGLDEVQANRQHLAQRVENFAGEYIPLPAADPDAPPVAGNRLIVTSRIVGYDEAPLTGQRWRTYTLEDFGRPEIEQFANQWTLAFALSLLGDSQPTRQAAEQERQELLGAIFSRPSVERLASNPLLLTILALIKYTGVSLPEQRVKLYELYLEALIASWSQARNLDKQPLGEPLKYEAVVNVLAPLALWLRRENPDAGLVSREQLLGWLTGHYAGEAWCLPPGDAHRRAEIFLESVNKYTNLLLERGEGQYGFLHLTLEEMLAAKGLARLYFADPAAAHAHLRHYLPDAKRWHETLQLLVGEIGVRQQLPAQAGTLLEELLAFDLPDGQAVLFAGQALLDAGRSAVSRQAVERVTAALVDLMQSPAAPIQARRDAGDRLGRLGWRPEPDPDGDDLLLAPAGLEPTGLDALRAVETPTGRVWLGKYPVTNYQFDRFIEAEGYDRREFWSDEGWAWRNGANPGLERIADEDRRKSYEEWLARRPANRRDRPFYREDREWNSPLCPVVGVSWFEAEAYTRWLSQELAALVEAPPAGCPPELLRQLAAGQMVVRLPTEAEWAAAMGGRGDFPWGDDFDFTKLNCAEAWAGREFKDDDEWWKWVGSDEESWQTAGTTAVTTFPAGASPAGVWDGSGNVWEWQVDVYDPKEGTRSLRGGSWNDNPRFARVSNRNVLHPDIFSTNSGFRYIVAPVLSF